MGVAEVITRLATLEAALSGVKRAHDETPESLAEMPAFINYPRRGTITPGDPPGQIKGLHTIVSELHIARGILPEAESVARPFISSFPIKVADDFNDGKLNGTVDALLEIRYEYGQLPWGEKEIHMGIRFETDVKLKEDVA